MAVKDYSGEVKYVGCVMDKYEHNGYDDSDFYAVVVNAEQGTIEEVEYATTRAWCGDCYAQIDITEENYIRYLHNAKSRHLRNLIASDRGNAKKVEKGKEVKVVKGRKVPIGTVGTIFWEKEVNFDPYGRFCGQATKIGIKDKDSNVYWTYADNVEVAEPKKYHKSVQELLKLLNTRRSNEFLRCKKIYNW